MLTLTTLASGSSGNSTLVSDGTTHLLIDAGISARRITTALKGLGIDPRSSSGVLVTHEHSDHICRADHAGQAALLPRLCQPRHGGGAVLPHPRAGGADARLSPGDVL